MDIVEIKSVEEQTLPLGDVWVVRYIDSDGNEVAHFMPKKILAYRAAEYDIDPSSVDTLMDIVLHENYIDEADQLDGEPRLHDPGCDTAAARIHHIRRVTKTKKRMDDNRPKHKARLKAAGLIFKSEQHKLAGFAAVAAITGDLLAVIKEDHLANLDRVEEIKESAEKQFTLPGDVPVDPGMPDESSDLKLSRAPAGRKLNIVIGD